MMLRYYDARTIVERCQSEPSGFSPCVIGEDIRVRLFDIDDRRLDILEHILARGGFELQHVDLLKFADDSIDYVMVWRKVKRCHYARLPEHKQSKRKAQK